MSSLAQTENAESKILKQPLTNQTDSGIANPCWCGEINGLFKRWDRFSFLRRWLGIPMP